MTLLISPAQPAAALYRPELSGAATKPQHDPQLGNTTEGMIDSLADSVKANGVHDDHADTSKAFGNTLGALIDIATFKLAPEMAYRAEKTLLGLYADPTVSSSVNSEMMKQLIETQDILAGNSGPRAAMFAMPASLLHLVGQFARSGTANQEASAIPPRGLEDIKSRLIDAIGVQDERNEGRDILDPARFVTTDEVGANFAKIHCGYTQEINISDGITDEAMKQQFEGLLNAAAEKGRTIAPLFCNGHFMLASAVKSSIADKYTLMIVNTHTALDETGTEALNALSKAERSDPGKCKEIKDASVWRYDRALRERLSKVFTVERVNLRIHSRQLQEHAINSCGPLISLLAENIDANGRRHIIATIEQCFDRWGNLNAQQQQTIVMAQRAKMIGDTVEARMKSRFVDLSAP